ncbi:MAG: hypothetical protein LBU16_08665 [Treponema sp.]|nr:hypothetical protein [Treponema sp.]
MTMKQFVFGCALLASIFASGALMPGCAPGGGLTDEEKPDDDSPGLVVAIWGRYLTEATANALKDDFIAYCATEGIAHGDIAFRYKAGSTAEDAYYEVAAFGQAVLAESGANIVFPVGANIGTTGGVTALAGADRKKALASVADAGSSSANRQIGYLTDDALTGKFYNDYIELERAKTILAVDRRAQ